MIFVTKIEKGTRHNYKRAFLYLRNAINRIIRKMCFLESSPRYSSILRIAEYYINVRQLAIYSRYTVKKKKEETRKKFNKMYISAKRVEGWDDAN